MSDAETLEALLEEGAIDEVLGQLQSGKEASLYVVKREGVVIAAKVYKARERRSFKNDALYTEGRKVRSSRDERALARGSKHGKATREAAWKSAESETLQALHAAGVRVPRPIAFHDGVVLMELVTDARGEPAPRLIDSRPSPEVAKEWHAILLGEIVKMLLAGWIHGDLSAYNVLVSTRGPVIIDFPQSVSAAHNQQAKRLVERDANNVTSFLAGFAPELAKHQGAGADIWRRYERGDLAPDWTPGAPLPPAPPASPDSADPSAAPEVPAPGAAPLDSLDELAQQIAQATAMPHSVGRALGRKNAPPRPPREPAAPEGHAPGRKKPRPGPGERRGKGGRSERRPAAARSNEGRPSQERRPHEGRPPQDGRPPHERRPHEGRPPQERRPHEGRSPQERRPQEGRPPQDRRPHAGRPPQERRPHEDRVAGHERGGHERGPQRPKGEGDRHHGRAPAPERAPHGRPRSEPDRGHRGGRPPGRHPDRPAPPSGGSPPSPGAPSMWDRLADRYRPDRDADPGPR